MENNNQAHITVYTCIGKFERVKKTLVDQFANMSKEVTDSVDENGVESFVVRLKDDSDIQLSINTNQGFIGHHIHDMYNFFANVECENKKLLQSVLHQIQVFNCVIGGSFNLDDDKNRTNYIVNTMFAAAKDINGLVLMPDMRLFDSDGKLVFSAEGESDFNEYTPIANADFIDGSVDTARKERSIAVLKEKGIPYMPQLRAAVMESEAKSRTPEEIARRLFAMFGVCVYCEVRSGGQTKEETQKYLNKINDILGGELDDSLTPEEKAFLAVQKPEQRDLARFGWRYECCHVLMWALGIIDELGYPEQICDVSAMGGIIWRQDSLAGFLEGAKPRAKEEILDAADLVLRYNWACVDARIKGQKSPAKLNGEVVVEWHYALNWLIGANKNADWDNIKTHT
ncbi:MAG: DUF4272 domain-containing protein [Syntrophorhabdaceae bacterium]|nr:DUF4272 domain-containing protein [Syntrophorhabdaceae bacterium]